MWASYLGRPVNVGFVVNILTVEQVFLQVRRFSPVGIIPPMLPILILLSPTLKNFAVDSVCKYLKVKRERWAGLQPATTGDLTFNWNLAIIG